jgi:hypothetical protein
MQSVLNANNGYADVGTSEAVARGLQQAGLVVIKTADLHGKPVFRAFTKGSQAALKVSGYGVTTYKEVAKTAHLNDGPDYEAMILDRQEAHFD